MQAHNSPLNAVISSAQVTAHLMRINTLGAIIPLRSLSRTHLNVAAVTCEFLDFLRMLDSYYSHNSYRTTHNLDGCGMLPGQHRYPSTALANGATLSVTDIDQCLGWCGENRY